MEDVVLLLIAIAILGGIFTIAYFYYEYGLFVATSVSTAEAAYTSLQTVLNLTKASTYSCTPTLSKFSIYSSGIIAIKSPYSYSKATTYTGGVPAEGIIYYSSGQFFTLSPISTVTGNFTDTKICILPSKINPIITVQSG